MSTLNVDAINDAAGTGSPDFDNGLNATTNLDLKTGGTTALRINSSQHVGIGTTSPDNTLHVESASAGSVTANTAFDDLVVENSGDTGISILHTNTSSGAICFGNPAGNLSGLLRWKPASNDMDLGTNVASASLSLKYGNSVTGLSISGTGVVNIPNLTASSDVQTNGSKDLISVSDSRMKTDITDMTAGLSIINQLQPKNYKWISDVANGITVNQIGFIAQDINPVLPEAAPTEDILDENNNVIDVAYGFNGRPIIAALVNAVKELSTKCDDYEARLTALEP